MISLTSPFYLILLVSIPLIILTHFYAMRSTKRKAMKFANFEALERVTGSVSLPKNYLLLVLRILTVASLILALSGIAYWRTGETSEINFVIAIDASGSMLSQDITPNRLEAAKEAANAFVNTRTGQTKVAVISFAGIGYIEQRLTVSRYQVKNAINKISVKNTHGTAISDAIKTSLQVIAVEDKPGILILITDGRETVTSTEELYQVIKLAEEQHLTIYTIGVGTDEGGVAGLLPENMKISLTLDEGMLQKIADDTGGKYYRAQNQEELKAAYSEIASYTEGQIETKLTVPFLLLGILLLFIEWGLANTKFRLVP